MKNGNNDTGTSLSNKSAKRLRSRVNRSFNIYTSKTKAKAQSPQVEVVGIIIVVPSAPIHGDN